MEDQGCIADEALIAAFRDDGMPHHLDMLFQRHLEKVRAMIYQMVLNDADADDLTQEVFVRVARAIHNFHGRASFSTWLYRIAMNTSKSLIRKRQRNPIIDSVDVPDVAGDQGLQPDHMMAEKELDDRIQKALGELKPKLRAAVVLTIIQGISIPEAARVEGCALPTMYWRVHEARRLLKVWLKEKLQ